MAYLSEDTIEQFREPTFVVLLLIGAVVFALGAAFFVVGISINTAPPAPYVRPVDKQILIIGSVITVIVGAVMIRAAGRVVGW